MFTTHHVSHVTCRMSCVTCDVSRVTCHVSGVGCHVSPFFFSFYKVVERIGGGSVISRAYPILFQQLNWIMLMNNLKKLKFATSNGLGIRTFQWFWRQNYMVYLLVINNAVCRKKPKLFFVCQPPDFGPVKSIGCNVCVYVCLYKSALLPPPLLGDFKVIKSFSREGQTFKW